ncbi:MAG: ATPase domain-containing protein, partial [Pseudolysinimonas sp.]
MARPNASPYACSECGWAGAKWYGRCPECQVWGSIVERGRPVVAIAAASVPAGRVARPITDIGTESAAHWASGIAKFDRVLGGGLVPGAAILLSGEPGVGKSTLLLEVASRAARDGKRVLYVTAEESPSQVRLRAERTGALADELYLA